MPISFIITSPTIADKMSVAVRKANEGITSSLRSRLGKAPIHNLVVGAALQDTIAQRGILDAQEAAAPAIEAGTEVRMIISAYSANGVEVNLVEHRREIYNPAGPVVGAAGNGVLSRCLQETGETERKLVAVLRKSNPMTWVTLDPLALHSSASRARGVRRSLAIVAV